MSYSATPGVFNIAIIQKGVNDLEIVKREKNWQQYAATREEFIVAQLGIIADLKKEMVRLRGIKESEFQPVLDKLNKRIKGTQVADTVAGTLAVFGLPGQILGIGIAAANLFFKRDNANELQEEQAWFANQVAPYFSALNELQNWETRYTDELTQLKTARTIKYVLGGYIASQLIS